MIYTEAVSFDLYGFCGTIVVRVMFLCTFIAGTKVKLSPVIKVFDRELASSSKKKKISV